MAKIYKLSFGSAYLPNQRIIIVPIWIIYCDFANFHFSGFLYDVNPHYKIVTFFGSFSFLMVNGKSLRIYRCGGRGQ
jgi:hypothetical protein